jgi:hypothetical protein
MGEEDAIFFYLTKDAIPCVCWMLPGQAEDYVAPPGRPRLLFNPKIPSSSPFYVSETGFVLEPVSLLAAAGQPEDYGTA